MILIERPSQTSSTTHLAPEGLEELFWEATEIHPVFLYKRLNHETSLVERNVRCLRLAVFTLSPNDNAPLVQHNSN